MISINVTKFRGFIGNNPLITIEYSLGFEDTLNIKVISNFDGEIYNKSLTGVSNGKYVFMLENLKFNDNITITASSSKESKTENFVVMPELFTYIISAKRNVKQVDSLGVLLVWMYDTTKVRDINIEIYGDDKLLKSVKYRVSKNMFLYLPGNPRVIRLPEVNLSGVKEVKVIVYGSEEGKNIVYKKDIPEDKFITDDDIYLQ